MFHKKIICRRCKSTMSRIVRLGWFRLLPGSELHFCRYCNQPHLFWLGFDFKLEKPKSFIPR